MFFKHPEILYLLLLLVVPILIHLFQLRRFQKVNFTNVKFLKSVKLLTRKSAKLKKWLTLFSRLLLLACLIIGFSQPFIPNTKDFNKTQDTVIYLDNSFSMQAKGRNGSLLNEAIQDIINTLPENEKITLFTNNNTYRNSSIKDIKTELIQLKHAAFQLPYDAVCLKGKHLFSEAKNTVKNLIFVSDFQKNGKALNFETDPNTRLKFVQLQPELVSNTSIDSVYISNTTPETLELKVLLSNTTEVVDNLPLSLFNGSELLAKTAANIDGKAEASFTIPNNTRVNGKLIINDNALQYDNSFYFNINSKPKIKVLAISGNSSSQFLERIFTDDEFEYKSFNNKTLNYNLISKQNLIILNELDGISNALNSALMTFKNDDGHVLIIPSTTADLKTYTQLLKHLNLPRYLQKNTNRKQITGINYSHPLLKNTFYKKVTNFQYPRVETSYPFTSNTNAVLSYEDNTPFLVGANNAYAFSAAINTDNSNFKNAQLIIPVFYNLGLKSFELPKIYYTIHQQNSIAISTVLGQDDILTLNSEDSSIIPLQNTYSKAVVIHTDDLPNTAGILTVNNKTETLQNLSFNYNRNESALVYHNLNAMADLDLSSSFATAFTAIKSSTNSNALWKWFVIFALVFLLLEMLLLKYLK